MNKTSLIAICFLTSLTCSSKVTQFYPDIYYQEDCIYQNKILGFLLTFDKNWNLVIDPSKMDPDSRDFARDLNKRGIELLFIGTTSEKYLATRAIAVNLNEPALEYAQYIRKINSPDIENDSGLVEIFNGEISMIKWVYEKSGYRFVEFFFNNNTFDIRIAFWTRKEYFDNFLPVFESIISSLTITG